MLCQGSVTHSYLVINSQVLSLVEEGRLLSPVMVGFLHPIVNACLRNVVRAIS
jgi:hypothetical protein